MVNSSCLQMAFIAEDTRQRRALSQRIVFFDSENITDLSNKLREGATIQDIVPSFSEYVNHWRKKNRKIFSF